MGGRLFRKIDRLREGRGGRGDCFSESYEFLCVAFWGIVFSFFVETLVEYIFFFYEEFVVRFIFVSEVLFVFRGGIRIEMFLRVLGIFCF